MVPDPITDPWSVMYRFKGDKKWECWETYEGPQMAQQVFQVLTHGRLPAICEHRVERGWGAVQPDNAGRIE